MRLRRSSLLGTIDTALDDTSTILSSPGLAALPDIAAPDYMPLILDPAKIGGEPEIVYVTAHVGGEATATITRGKEQNYGSSPGRAHEAGITWENGPTAGEFIADYDGYVHDNPSDPIQITNHVALTLDADITAFTTSTSVTTCTLIAMQGAGGALVSTTGITITWIGGPPTLTTTTGNFDMLRLNRLTPDGSIWIGEVVGADLSLP